MRAIKYRELKRLYEVQGPKQTVRHLREALEQGHLRADDFSLRELAEAVLGAAWVRSLDPRGQSTLLEAGEGIDATAFSNIAGQVVQAKILEAYAHPAFALSKIVTTIPTRLDGERIPGVGRVADDAAEVAPGMPYPNVGFGEDYIDTPRTTKRGLIVPVTREAIFFDRTYLVLQRAAEVGEILGMNKEKRLLDLALGLANNYRWKGSLYNTYSAVGTGVAPEGAWINVIDNELVDWTDVDAAEQRLSEIVDPTTNEPVLVRGTTVLVMPAYRHAAQRVFAAGEINYSSGATTTVAPNPLGGYRVVESPLGYRRLLAAGISAAAARKYWVLGDFSRAFAYMENWPITVAQSALNSEAEFSQDIVVRFKASERGAAAVLNPRYVVRSTGSLA